MPDPPAVRMMHHGYRNEEDACIHRSSPTAYLMAAPLRTTVCMTVVLVRILMATVRPPTLLRAPTAVQMIAMQIAAVIIVITPMTLMILVRTCLMLASTIC